MLESLTKNATSAVLPAKSMDRQGSQSLKRILLAPYVVQAYYSASRSQGRPSRIQLAKAAMSISRQLHGVLEVITPSGTHYLSPSIAERLYLIWIFRNFRTLPLAVLNPTQRRKIESIAAKYKRANPSSCDEILGTVELVATSKKPVQSAVTAATRSPAQVTASFKSRASAGGD